MSSPSHINALNAQHSTGPRTEAGKKRSSLNALRHGLTSQVVVLPHEDLAAYAAFTAGFHQDLQPKNLIETQLVQSLADTQWRLNRCAALESNLYSLAYVRAGANDDPEGGVELTELQVALKMASAFRDNTDAIRTLSIHEQRLHRAFDNTLKQLKALQSQRKLEEFQQLQQAAMLQQANKLKGLPYVPAADGFVCSNQEIDQLVAAEARLKEAANASLYDFDPEKIAAAADPVAA